MSTAVTTPTKGASQAPFGILLVNLGSPSAPTPKAVRKYLAEFLSDPRVVSLPRWLWWPILHGIVLRIRPAKVAHAYQQIWRRESPLIEITRTQAVLLQQALARQLQRDIPVRVGMRYGKPELAQGLQELQALGVNRILIFPLYPQFSVSTTASVQDRIGELMKSCWKLPELRYVPAYFSSKRYIAALAQQVRRHWQEKGRGEQLIISFHGLPVRYSLNGDPYEPQCRATAERLATELGLEPSQWQIAFQSRFGKERWLEPYLEPLLVSLARAGKKNIDLICPGFSADCLETLEEISVRAERAFVTAGGQALRYIPALNDAGEHIELMQDLVSREVQGWLES